MVANIEDQLGGGLNTPVSVSVHSPCHIFLVTVHSPCHMLYLVFCRLPASLSSCQLSRRAIHARSALKILTRIMVGKVRRRRFFSPAHGHHCRRVGSELDRTGVGRWTQKKSSRRFAKQDCISCSKSGLGRDVVSGKGRRLVIGGSHVAGCKSRDQAHVSRLGLLSPPLLYSYTTPLITTVTPTLIHAIGLRNVL